MKLRVRWSRAGRALLAGALVLLAMRATPDLLKPSDPPKLPSDVGLPRVRPVHLPRRSLNSVQAQPHIGRVVSGGGPRRRAEAAEGKASSLGEHRPFARSSAKHMPR